MDADALVLDLVAEGAQPHPELGWLSEVEAAVLTALGSHAAVSVEATGAWDSDWQLADDLVAMGHSVVRVWVSAPLEVTLGRLAARTGRKAPVSEKEARSIWRSAQQRAEHHEFDLVLDTDQLEPQDLLGATAPLVPFLASEPDSAP